ncbi:hypothetical protein [Lyngbya aestuarii]|uniref:hypothetical protein n=1 Tax=Lyngbya aestuarii TaxID=118322 RepID=UPI00403DD7A0
MPRHFIQVTYREGSYFKQTPDKQATELPEPERAYQKTGTIVELLRAPEEAYDEHYKIDLVQPIKNFSTWYTYQPHVYYYTSESISSEQPPGQQPPLG